MKLLIRLCLLVVSIGVVLVTAACGDDDDSDQSGTSTKKAENSEVRLAFMSSGLQNSHVQAMLEGIEATAAKSNATVKAFDPNFQSNTQLQQIQDAATSQKFDALIVYPVDGAAAAPQVQPAIDAGMQVVSLFYPLGPKLDTLEPQVEGLTSTVGPDQKATATYNAEQAVEACADKDPCNVVYMPGLSSLPVEKLRTDEVKRVLGEHPNIKLVAVQDGGYSPQQAQSVMQNILQANPDVHVFFTPGDQMAVGAEKAINDAGLKGKVVIGGAGASEPAVAALKEGRWQWSVTLVPRSEGERAAELAIKAARGETVPEVVDSMEELAPAPVMTADNIGDFEAQWTGG